MPHIWIAFLCQDSPARTPHSSTDGISPHLLDLQLAESLVAITQVLAQAPQTATASNCSGIIPSRHEVTNCILSLVERSRALDSARLPTQHHRTSCSKYRLCQSCSYSNEASHFWLHHKIPQKAWEDDLLER